MTADDQANWVQLEVGNLLEDLVARIFAKKTGLKTVHPDIYEKYVTYSKRRNSNVKQPKPEET